MHHQGGIDAKYAIWVVDWTHFAVGDISLRDRTV